VTVKNDCQQTGTLGMKTDIFTGTRALGIFPSPAIRATKTFATDEQENE